MCLLARALMAQGHSVTMITSSEYHSLARALGVRPSIIDVDFESTIRFHKFNDVFYDKTLSVSKKISLFRDIARNLEDRTFDLLMYCLKMLRYFDLVVYNPFAFFAGQIAEELNIASVRVMCQPLLPTRRMDMVIFGGGDLGPVLNRLSYETFRPVSFLFRHAFRRFRGSFGAGRRLRSWLNPLTADIGFATQISAFSPYISPDPGDYPAPTTTTGYWLFGPEPGDALPREVMAFLKAGAPPIYIGFGSMVWGAQRNTEIVDKALSLWSGRAIVATGAGSLKPTIRSSGVMTVPSLKHSLLFPHVAGVVHHGGAGTTAQSLASGLPTVILPVLGDQFYWGRRVAALGAGPAPVGLRKVEPEALAARFAAATDDPGYRAAAQGIAAILSTEPGVSAAVVKIEECLARVADRWRMEPRARSARREQPVAGEAT
jgi:sterol 3beta-glucosyltransferase